MSKMSDEYVTTLQNTSIITDECAKKLVEASGLCQRVLTRGEFSSSNHVAIIALLDKMNKLVVTLQETIRIGAIPGLAALDAEEKKFMLELQEKRKIFLAGIPDANKPKRKSDAPLNASPYTRGIFAHPIQNALGKKTQILKTTRVGVMEYLKANNKPPYGEQSEVADILEALKAINAPEILQEMDAAAE